MESVPKRNAFLERVTRAVCSDIGPRLSGLRYPLSLLGSTSELQVLLDGTVERSPYRVRDLLSLVPVL